MTLTSENQALIDEVYQTAYEYLPKLYKGFITTAEELRLGNWTTAFDLIPLLMDGLEWNLTVLQRISVLNFEDSEGDHYKISNDLLSQMKSANKAIESADYIAVADIFQYEMAEKLEDWWTVVNHHLFKENY